MFRSRVTAGLILGVLVFYNTGSLLGLHGHRYDSISSLAIHAHGAQSRAPQNENLCQAAPARASASVALVQPQEESHIDFSLISDFIIGEVGAVTASPLVHIDSVALSGVEPVLPEPPARAGMRIRDGTLPDFAELNTPAASRAPPLRS